VKHLAQLIEDATFFRVSLFPHQTNFWLARLALPKRSTSSASRRSRRWKLGLLRSRELANGHTEVLLGDVLFRRAKNEALVAIDNGELPPEKLRILKEGCVGKNPWEEQ